MISFDRDLAAVLSFVMCRAGVQGLGLISTILNHVAATERDLVAMVVQNTARLAERDAKATLKKTVEKDMRKWQKQVGSVDEWSRLSELAKSMDAKSELLPGVFTASNDEGSLHASRDRSGSVFGSSRCAFCPLSLNQHGLMCACTEWRALWAAIECEQESKAAKSKKKK
eukprot:SAG11_NODE_901_length_6623_cov_3.043225_3_plen_170_part_00